ncbi:hypothetical protein D3C79_923690 [compost metagenome]
MALATEKRVALFEQHPLLQAGLGRAAQAQAERGGLLQQTTGHIRTAQHIDLQLHLGVVTVKLRKKVIVGAGLDTADAQQADLARHCLGRAVQRRPQARDRAVQLGRDLHHLLPRL